MWVLASIGFHSMYWYVWWYVLWNILVCIDMVCIMACIGMYYFGMYYMYCKYWYVTVFRGHMCKYSLAYVLVSIGMYEKMLCIVHIGMCSYVLVHIKLH